MKKKKWEESELKHLSDTCIMIDNNGSLYRKYAEQIKDAGKQVVVMNFKNPRQREGWNPLTLVYEMYQKNNIGEAITELQRIGHILFHSEVEDSDPYWENMASDFFTGLSLILMKEGNESEIHFGSVRKLIEEAVNTNLLISYVDSLPTMYSEVLFVNPTLKTPMETRKSILSIMQSNFNDYVANPCLNEMLSKTTVDVTRKDVCYFIIPDKDSKLTNIVVEQLNLYYQSNLIRYDFENHVDYNISDTEIDYPVRKENHISYIELPNRISMVSREDNKKYRQLLLELENMHTFDSNVFMKCVWESWDIQDRHLKKEIYQKLGTCLKEKTTLK